MRRSAPQVDNMTGATRALADWIHHISAELIPDRELKLARSRVIDTLGLLYAGSDTPANKIAIDLAAAQGGRAMEQKRRAAVVGDDGLWLPGWAAFVNGVTAHCRDFDDTFPGSVVHPGSVVVPTALAVGASEGASDEDVLAAIVVGYEIAARLGMCGGRHLHAKGFHATGIYAPIIATAVASKLMHLPAPAIQSALGLSCSMSGGLLEFLENGSWSKWLHVGWGAFGGISAARLASNGFAGPVTALEGKKGLYAAFVGGSDAHLAALIRGLGEEWFGDTALPKYYPCAHVIQPYLSALILAARDVTPEFVSSVTCVIAPWAVQIVCEPAMAKKNPHTEMDVIASLQFLAAAALVDRQVRLDILTESQRRRSDLLALAARIDYRSDPALGAGFDGKIEIRMTDGRLIETQVSELTLDPQRIDAKAIDLISSVLGADRAAGVIAAMNSEDFNLVEDWNRMLSEPRLRAVTQQAQL
jgi:2-methylcitrate dehydratase PrpD